MADMGGDQGSGDEPGRTGDILDSQAAPEPPSLWPVKRWAAVARDRVGDIGAVTCVQRSNAKGFFAMTSVYVRRDSRWQEEFSNGDLWPLNPTDPRPDSGSPIASLTGVTGAAVGEALVPVAFLAGVVTTAVTELWARSPAGEHRIEISERLGAFVALTIQPEGTPQFRLAALDRAGRELDLVEFSPSW